MALWFIFSIFIVKLVSVFKTIYGNSAEKMLKNKKKKKHQKDSSCCDVLFYCQY